MYLFENEVMLKKLEDECESWRDTPYKHRCHVKGAGCDCVGFVAGVLNRVGLASIDFNKLPNYPRDYAIHKTRTHFLDTARKYLNCDITPIVKNESYDLKDGDLVFFNFGKSAGHAGIWIKGWMYESMDRMGVKKTLFKTSPWRKRATYIVRLKTEGDNNE